MGVDFVYRETGQAEWQTMIFTTLAFIQIAQAFATRSALASLRSIGLMSNRLMLGVAGLVLGLQLVAIYTPVGDFMDLVPLSLFDLAVCVAAGLGLLAALEGIKSLGRRALVAETGASGSRG